MDLNRFLEKRSTLFWGVFGSVLAVLIGFADYLIGYEVSLSLLYLGPVSLISWYSGLGSGLAISLICGFVWLTADVANGHTYASPIFFIWDILMRLGFFVVVAFLLSQLRKAIQTEREMSRIDYITGVTSTRRFYEVFQKEIERARKSQCTITLAYIDLDNFKLVNDNLGHSTGDIVLRTVTSCIQQNIKNSDTIGRLGGDEFVLLLPETDLDQAQAAINRMRARLLAKMRENTWPVTFSIGVITFLEMPETVDIMLRIADDLMYTVKTSGKNRAAYREYPERKIT